MAIPDEYRTIINRLVAATKERRVAWIEGHDEAEFYVVFKEFTLTAQAFYPEYGEPFVKVLIRNHQGDTLDSFDVADELPDHKMLIEMLDGARRIARRINEALAAIESELSDDGPIGTIPEDAPPPPSDDDIPF